MLVLDHNFNAFHCKMVQHSAEKYGFFTIHILMVTVVCGLVILSSNKETLFLLFIAVGLIYALCLRNEGCLLTEIESDIPFIEAKGTNVVMAALGLAPGEISLPTLEKILIGSTLFFVGFKLLLVWSVESYTGRPYCDLLCKIANGRATLWAKTLA
jgi:hypothetical protein